MNPKELASSMTSVTVDQPGLSLEELTQHLVDRDVSPRDAERATNFFQVACGRIFLEGLGVAPSEKYVCFDGEGVIVEGGTLVDEPTFAASLEALRACPPSAFMQIALSSSEVNAVNTALNAGADPQNLVATPTAMFTEPATPEGLAIARRVLLEMSAVPRTKPWWKFWG